MPSPSLLYPYTLGMMAAVNPCGFPLLPAYLEFFVGPSTTTTASGSGRPGTPGQPAAPERPAVRAGRAVTAAAFATAGFLLLFGPLGLVTQLGWSALAGHSASVARYAMVVMGLAMVGLGALTLARRSFKLPLPRIGSGTGLRRPAALAVFGFSYGVASIGCALPLFIGGVASSFSSGSHSSSIRAVSGLVAYGLGMGTILGALAMGIALLGRGAGRPLRVASRWVPVVGGAVLVAVGAYLSWYWITDIADPGHSFVVQRLVNRIQVDISNPIDAHAQLIGGLLGAAVIAAVVAGGLAGGVPRAGTRPRAEGDKAAAAPAPPAAS